jgi:hypothetical protein
VSAFAWPGAWPCGHHRAATIAMRRYRHTAASRSSAIAIACHYTCCCCCRCCCRRPYMYSREQTCVAAPYCACHHQRHKHYRCCLRCLCMVLWHLLQHHCCGKPEHRASGLSDLPHPRWQKWGGVLLHSSTCRLFHLPPVTCSVSAPSSAPSPPPPCPHTHPGNTWVLLVKGCQKQAKTTIVRLPKQQQVQSPV